MRRRVILKPCPRNVASRRALERVERAVGRFGPLCDSDRCWRVLNETIPKKIGKRTYFAINEVTGVRAYVVAEDCQEGGV